MNIRKYFNPNEYPTNEWYRKHLERNFDTIVLGDGNAKAWLRSVAANSRCFDMTLWGQTVAIDYLVLQQTFSILKKDGKVVFLIDGHSCICGWEKKKDMRPYFWLFWPYSIAKNKLHLYYIKVAKRIPFIMLRLSDVPALLLYTEKDIFANEQKRKMKDLARLNDLEKLNGTEKTANLMSDIITFCEERDIKPVFSFIPSVTDDRVCFKCQNELQEKFLNYFVNHKKLDL